MLGSESPVVKSSQSIVPREDTSQHRRQMCRRYLHELSKVNCAKEGRRGSPIRDEEREGRGKVVSQEDGGCGCEKMEVFWWAFSTIPWLFSVCFQAQQQTWLWPHEARISNCAVFFGSKCCSHLVYLSRAHKGWERYGGNLSR